jgi:FAD-dependent oxidoreductase family protein
MLRSIAAAFNPENMQRRSFLQLLASPLLSARELRCDVGVIGGGVGGCAAALAALRNGMRVVLTEETDWIGGQLTSQAVPPDEHPWIEAFGCTRLYRTYRRRVREFYETNYPLTELARGREFLNPGGGTVSRLTHEPRVSLAVLEAMLAPYASNGQLTVLLDHRPTSADVQGNWVRSVTVGDRTITAAYFLDATEQGDLLPLTKTEYVTGSESRMQTGEQHASVRTEPHNIQSFTYCFAMEYRKGEDYTIEKPGQYTFWRDYVPKLHPHWPGKLLSWEMTNPITLEKRHMGFDPEKTDLGAGIPNLWFYRRIATRQNVKDGAEVTLVNWPQNDYLLGNLHEVSHAEAVENIKRSKQLSLSLLYWMQTECGWKGLRIRPDIVGTEDGLAKYPYIRESRRIHAEFTVLEQHVGHQARDGSPAEEFKDSVGVGSYRIDLHPSSGGDNYIDISSMPFQIPLGALIPKRMENLIPACKNLGVTHITNGCYRLHPVEWNIGESAGALVAHAIKTKSMPRHIRNDPKRLAEFQKAIEEQGIEIVWPRLTAQ